MSIKFFSTLWFGVSVVSVPRRVIRFKGGFGVHSLIGEFSQRKREGIFRDEVFSFEKNPLG